MRRAGLGVLGVLGVLYLHGGITGASGWIMGVIVFRYHGRKWGFIGRCVLYSIQITIHDLWFCFRNRDVRMCPHPPHPHSKPATDLPSYMHPTSLTYRIFCNLCCFCQGRVRVLEMVGWIDGCARLGALRGGKRAVEGSMSPGGGL